MFGLFLLPWWGYLLVLLGLTQMTIFAVTLYLHRCQAHRSLELHPIVSHFFRFWLWLTTGMITKEWTAIHRKHHAKVETQDDPHSPQTRGIKKVFFEGAELYRDEALNAETVLRYGEGTPNDWVERNIYTRFCDYGIWLMLVIDVLCFGVLGITIWALQMAWIPFFAAGVVNGIGHYWGYRNYECKDASRNIIPFGFFIGGEELHNNHHAFATSAKFSTKWWEFDSGWAVIKTLSKFKLAKARRVVPKLTELSSKKEIDGETLKALFTHRLQIMANYTRDVILPALQEERKRAGKKGAALLQHTRSLLIRDTSIMKAPQRMRLAKVLEQFHKLSVVYHYKMKLQEIWSASTKSQKELLDALQDWCQQAEATRIEVLKLFSHRIKMLVVAQPG